MEKSDKLKIMISGVSGFLGKSLAIHLSKKYDIRSVSIRHNNLTTVGEEILEYQPDIFIYNGWSDGNNFNGVNSYEQFSNINIAIELGRVFSQLKNLHFVGVGSFAEYGINKTSITEEDPEYANNYYGASKNILKLFTRTLCEVNNFKWLWLRPCYVYGPGDVQSRLIPMTVQACIDRQNLTLNSCNSVADYLYIDDFTSAVDQLLSGKHTGIFNICSGKEYVVRDVVNTIKQEFDDDYLGLEHTITFDATKDRKNSYTNHLCGDNSKLQLTGWCAKHDIQSGIKKTIKSYEK